MLSVKVKDVRGAVVWRRKCLALLWGLGRTGDVSVGTERKAVHQFQCRGQRISGSERGGMRAAWSWNLNWDLNKHWAWKSRQERKSCLGNELQGVWKHSARLGTCEWRGVAEAESCDSEQWKVWKAGGIGARPQKATLWGLNQSWRPWKTSSSFTHWKVQGPTKKAGFQENNCGSMQGVRVVGVGSTKGKEAGSKLTTKI